MNDTTKILIRGGAILVSGLLLVFVGKKLIVNAKKKKEEKRLKKLQEDSQGMGTEQATQEKNEADSYNPASDLKRFESYVHGINSRTYHNEVNSLYDKLTDSKLCKLDKAHRRKHKDSMAQWLRDEWGGERLYKASLRRLQNAGCG